jgi:hypothetical protein
MEFINKRVSKTKKYLFKIKMRKTAIQQLQLLLIILDSHRRESNEMIEIFQ